MDRQRLSRAHGAFNVIGGLWPLASIRSFEAVFGPKADRWLEYTVACLLISNGAAQLLADQDDATARRVGVGTAASLLVIDLVFVPRGRIRWTYLLDAAMEVGWLAAWARQARVRA
ncbi:hypothetical protein DDE18_08245 [Nocardioides gansuensis]|uniref:Uncharacterized protein n=1 Tax=Nocardioides gansuensis TaxID=2138300 RepID=A0A2T8FC41_9ACTN|nr:hypothetical protein [Nocardioides gansuensis]PVG83277.1 hypothetical protein DDE18_08245 [Nocardioides gansuensis]